MCLRAGGLTNHEHPIRADPEQNRAGRVPDNGNMETILVFALGGVSAAAAVIILVLLLRKASTDAPRTLQTVTMAERVRAVGKLVGLEVHAKEIATSKQGWAWLPPILLSQAKIAMIFHFEKQYAVDLARVSERDVEELGPGRFRVTLPPVEGALRLTDVTPYDIQAGRLFAMLDVIQMTAERQKMLIGDAQHQAAELFDSSDTKYVGEAKRSIEQHLRSLFRLVDADVEIGWSAGDTAERPKLDVELAGA